MDYYYWLLTPFVSVHRSLTGSPRSSSESHSPLYMHPPKCTSCGSQSPQHTEMCLHTAGPTFHEEMGETHSEYSDSSCGESLSLPSFSVPGRREDPLLRGICVLLSLGHDQGYKSIGTHHHRQKLVSPSLPPRNGADQGWVLNLGN